MFAQTLYFPPVWRNLPFLLEGALLTAWISLITALLGFVIGIGIALLKLYAGAVGRLFANAYIEVWRNTPLLVQLFIFFFGLPSLGIRLTPLQATLIVFSLNAGAFIAEIVRGGIASVPRGHYEAATALAFSNRQTLRYIVMPPALKAATPALANQFILIVLGTSIASVIATPELTFRASILDTQIFRSFEIYLVLIAIYFVIARLLIILMRVVIKRSFRTTSTASVPEL